jgi:tubulin monoglycylase TTLL3/8
VKSITNKDIFYDKIQPRMKKIVIDVLKSVEDMVLYRKRSIELYGFDFMIDENLNRNKFKPCNGL